MNYFRIGKRKGNRREGEEEATQNKNRNIHIYSIERVHRENIHIILPFWYITYLYINI